MAHMVDTMAYRLAGGLPWHGFGNAMPDGVSIPEAFRIAEMTWKAEMHRAFVRNPNWLPGMPSSDKAIEVPNLRVALRNDTWAPIGYASASYVPIQLEDLATVWERALTDANGVRQGEVETVISLAGGARIVLVMKVPGDWTIAGEAHKPYLTATTSFDSSSNATWGLTVVRVVCNNTLGTALGEWRNNTTGVTLSGDDVNLGNGTNAVRIRHRGNVAAKLEKVSNVFERAFADFNGTRSARRNSPRRGSASPTPARCSAR